MEHNIEIIAHNLQKIRESRKLSLDKLSEITGVSKSMLRQIEKAKSSPTISTMWKIANGLKISFTTLLTEETPKAIIKNFKSSAPLFDKSGHYRVYPLIPFDPKFSIEMFYLEMDAFVKFEGEPHQGNIEEQIFVYEGCLNLYIENKEYKINENEFIRFKADSPHVYESNSKKGLKALLQIYYFN